MNFLITPLDGVLTEITTTRRSRRPRSLHRPRGEPLLRDRVHDPGHDRPDARLRVHRRATPRQARPVARGDDELLDADKGPEVSPEAEAKELRYALFASVAVRVVIALLDRPPRRPAPRPRDWRHHRRVAVHGQPDRDHHDHLLRGGLAYGGSGTIRTSDDVLALITNSWAASRAFCSCSC